MTSHDHIQVMSKPAARVGIADLKAHLSSHLRKVRAGHTLTVIDRETPIARLVPYESEGPLEVRKAIRRPAAVRVAPPTQKATHSLAVLLEDRAAR